LLDNEYLLEQYIAENLDQLSTRDINILTSFKKRITGDFIIVKCLKKHAIFIHAKSNKMYTVYALNDTFDSFFDHFPVLITTTLLPFKDKIIYDGFIQNSNIHIGPRIAKSLNDQ